MGMPPQTAETRWLRLLPAQPPAALNAHPDWDASGAREGGDQRIAWALYDAQMRAMSAATGAGSRPRRRTLAEIVSMGGDRRKWGIAFKQLKADGLVQEQTLGQVIARWARTGGGSPRG
jgi:hypothetical protein